jgi:hypothetical protein
MVLIGTSFIVANLIANYVSVRFSGKTLCYTF